MREMLYYFFVCLHEVLTIYPIHPASVHIRVWSSSKNSKKNLDFYCFVTSLKTDSNVPSKSKKQNTLKKKKNIFFVDILKATNENSRNRILTLVVRISGSGSVPKCLVFTTLHPALQNIDYFFPFYFLVRQFCPPGCATLLTDTVLFWAEIPPQVLRIRITNLSQILSSWLGGLVDSGIGLSYR